MQSLPDSRRENGTLIPFTSAAEPLYELETANGANTTIGSGLQRLFDALYRYRLMVLAIVVVCLALAVGITFLISPYYQADGSIVIDRPNQRLAELKPTVPGSYDEDREIQTELTELASRSVAARVISELNLEQRDPEIAKALSRARQNAVRNRRTLSADDALLISEDVFLSKLKSVPDKLSRTVHVQYGSHNPALAAEVVNRTVNDFVDYSFSSRIAVGDRISRWLRQQLAGVQDRLTQDQTALVNFQTRHGFVPLVIPGGQQNVMLDQVASASHQLTQAQADRVNAEALLQIYPTTTLELPNELRTPAIEQAVLELAAARKDLDADMTMYQPDFPLVKQARDRVQRDEARLQELNAEVKSGLEKRLAAAQQREAGLQKLILSLSGAAAGESATEMQYQVLKARADGEQQLYNTLTEKLNEASLMGSMPNSNVRVLDAALRPAIPVYPQMPVDLGLGLVVGVALAVLTALVRDRVTGAITGAEALSLAGISIAPLGLIPDCQLVLESEPKTGNPGKLLAAGPTLLPANTRMSESYAKLAANLVARAGAPHRSLLLTSANPGEGKTMTICNLGLALARAGWRTLIIDADARRPGCHLFFGTSNEHGLIEAQRGVALTPVAVAPNLDLVPCEREPEAQLQARTLSNLLEHVTETYDYVLVDSPPGNLTGDAITLSQMVNHVVVVLRWGSTTTTEARQLCEELLRARAPLLGTVLNRADLSAPEFRYYRRHEGYYTAAAA